MTPLPIAQWQASLSEMEIALAGTLSSLDRYQVQWQNLLGEQMASSSPPASETPLSRLRDRLQEWDSHLAVASELASSVERQLTESESAVGRWQTLFSAWREVIQSGVEKGKTSE